MKIRFTVLPSFQMSAALLALLISLAGCATSIDDYLSERAAPSPGTYLIVGTGQSRYWNTDGTEMAAPAVGDALYGQNAQNPGMVPGYLYNGDGTVSDLVTGLMWTQTLDLNGDGTIDTSDKRTLVQAAAGASAITAGGYSDWRLPTIKQLYSLINFNGTDLPTEATDSSRSTPFIDTRFFDFGYGDLEAGDRIIDAQCATSTLYVDKTFLVFQTMFGVNFADGRIKGYPLDVSMQGLGESDFYVYYVRDNLAYGVNDFYDNGDGTITDRATCLMWSQADSGAGMDWAEALTWVQARNAENYRGHSDWRLPDIKELQSIVDYSRSPATTGSAAIDPEFSCTEIKNEAGQVDYGFYWSSTTHQGFGPNAGAEAAYISFGRGMGKMVGLWMDVHGAGCQRSDPKVGNAADYTDGRGPQGDAIRIDNFVRLVRDAE